MDELRRVTEVDWALLRDVRLRALTEAPTAFGATAAASRNQPDTHWRERAGGPFPTLVVVDALLAWSRERALATYLQVTEGNDTALALYASRGFEPTGVRVPLRPGSTTYAAEMRLPPPG